MTTQPKRGRPPKAATEAKNDVIATSRREANQAALANTIALVNNMAMAVLQANHLALEEQEALIIADSFLAIADEIDISVSPLTQAIINAGTTLVFVYGSKVALHKMTQGQQTDAIEDKTGQTHPDRGQDTKRKNNASGNASGAVPPGLSQ